MDPYNKEHPHIKDYVQELRTNELSSLEEVHGDSQQFSVDEPLGVELRYALGSLDAQVLLDTHGPRENHWDFVRQERDRFQVSNEENTSLLMDVKQDDLKPFDNCEGWSGSTSQVDTHLFIDTQEGVNMIAEAFGGKDESMAQDDGRMSVPSFKHQEEVSQLTVESKVLEENASIVDNPYEGMDACEVVEASQPPVETPDKGTSQARSSVEVRLSDDQVREVSQCEPMGEARPGEEQSMGVIPASSIDEAECQVLQNANEEAGIFQDLPLECSKEPQLSYEKLNASDDVVVGSSRQTLGQVRRAREHADTQASLVSDAQDSPKLEGPKTCYHEAKANSKNSFEKLEEEKQSLMSTDNWDSAGVEFKGTPQESQEKGTDFINPMAEVIVDMPGIRNAPDPFGVNHERDSQDAVNLPKGIDLGSDDGATSIASPNTIPMRENDSETNLNDHLEEFCNEDAAGGFGSAVIESRDEPGKGHDAEAYKEEESGMVVEVEAYKEDAAGAAGRTVVEPDDMFAKVDEAQAFKDHTVQVVGGSPVVEPHNLPVEVDEVELKTEELNGPGEATQKSGVIEQVAAEREVAAPDLPHVMQTLCSTPATTLSVHSAEYVCRDGGQEGDTSINVEAPQGDGMPGVLSDTRLTTSAPEPCLREFISQDDTRNRLDTSQPSAGDDDGLTTSDCNKEREKLTGENILPGLGQKNGVLAIKASTAADKVLHNRVEAGGGSDERSRQGTPKDITEGSAVSTQELNEKDDRDHGMVECSVSSTKPGLAAVQGGVSAEMFLPDGGSLTEMSQPDGSLHVLLNVHKDVASSEWVPRTTSVQDQLNTLGVADHPFSYMGDTVTKSCGIIEDSTRFSDANASSPMEMAATCGSQEPAGTGISHDTTPQHKASKRNTEASMRNNRLKDSARASPLQTRSDEEQKSAGNLVAGRRKTPAKLGVQSKQNEPLEDYPSPRNSGSKGASSRKGKKDISPPMVQEAMASPVVQESIQAPSSTSKSMSSVNASQSSLPDLNVSEMAVPMVPLPSQPFSEPQQLQLRAQILVYGALIQGVAPEEALMVAAFSTVTGEAGKQMEASGRASWEKEWQAAVDRIQSKSSVLRDPARASGVLVPNLLPASAKTFEEGVSSLHGRVSEGQITKGNTSHSRHNGDLGAGISMGKITQSAPVVLPSVSSISTIPRSMPSLPGDNLTQTSRPRTDLQQSTPRMYLPAPPQGTLLSGASHWLSPPPFSGPWLSQTQGAVYSVPSAIFNHPQTIVSINQTSEKGTIRRNAPSPSVPVVPTPAPGAGSFPITPATSGAEMVQNREPVLESRPRKRKKTQPDTYGSPVVTAYTGNQATSYPTLPIASSLQAGSLMFNQVHMSTIAPTESLAMVAATPQAPKTIPPVALHTENVLAPGLLNARVSQPTSNTGLGDSSNTQRSGSQLEQAQASAEEAALVAASAVRESEALWSQLRAQRSAGLTSNMEMQLVSSAVAMTTAVSVAKAAAAAATAAYEAALQAKSISEGALELSKQGSALESSRLLQDSEASRTWQVPEGCNSIMQAAKMASKKRLEAASAAIVRAQNFEAIVKAAELATTAVTQIGSIVAMGESVPFNLDMLMDVGPESFHRLLSPQREKSKEQAQIPGKKDTSKQKLLEEKDKKTAKKSSGTKKSQEGKGVIGRKDIAMVVCAEAGSGLLTEFDKQKGRNQSVEGLNSSAVDMVQQEAPVSDNQIAKDSHVEVMSDEKGLRGVWFSATAQNVEGGKVLVLYNDLLSDDGVSPLEEWIPLNGLPSKAPRVRLAHPNKTIGFEGTRKRRREALGSHKWSVGDRVDAWIRDGWWEGEIREIIEDGESKAKVFFPGDGDTSLVKLSKLRPSLEWKEGQWVLWTADAKGGKTEPKLRADTHESETPIAKRQKTDKHQASSTSNQKIVGIGTSATGTSYMDNNVSDNALVKPSRDIKGFTVDGPDRARQQGPNAVFGVPKPTKKRKLIEVSKHFSMGRGARSVNPLNRKANGTGKDEDAGTATVGFAIGSIEAKKSEGFKAKKKVAFGTKAKPQKGADSETGPIKGSGVRTRKDKPAPPTKASGRKDTPIKGAIPAISRNSEGKFMKKKVATSDVGQSEPSQEQPGQVVPARDAVLQGVATGSQNVTPVMVEEGGTEPSNTAVGRDHANSASESKQTSLSSRKEAAHASGSVKESKTHAHPSRENQKQSLNEAKESQLHLVKGRENQPSDLGVNEKQPSSPPKENNDKQGCPPSKDADKGKDAGKPGLEGWEPRRTSRKIQPTSKLLEGLQTAPKLGKSSSSHDRGSRVASKAPP